MKTMVNFGIPVRESTKADVPSLLPLPAIEAGFNWRQRKRRRSRRRVGARSSSPTLTVRERKEAFRRRFDPLFLEQEYRLAEGYRDGFKIEKTKNSEENPSEISTNNSEETCSGEKKSNENDSDKKQPKEQSDYVVDGANILSKGAVNGEGEKEGSNIVAMATRGANDKDNASEHKGPGLGVGRLLVRDWKLKNSEMELELKERGLRALDRKRRRMVEFSQNRAKLQQKKLEIMRSYSSSPLSALRKNTKENNKRSISRNSSIGGSVSVSSAIGGGHRRSDAIDGAEEKKDDEHAVTTAVEVDDVSSGAAVIDLKPGGKRWRNEADTLKIRSERKVRLRRAPIVLARESAHARAAAVAAATLLNEKSAAKG